MQITKLSFLSTQAVGDNVFAVEEFLEVPIDQVFGTHRAREKALFNFIDSDAVEKVSRDTWRIVKDITLDAANVKMRQGDYFRVRLDEEGDDSPIHFGLDATGVFVLSRAVFASLQTYRVLEPGKQESIRMQFTFGGNPVVDAKLTSKFASMDLVPVDATAGIYELKVYTAMAPSDDVISIEVTGTSLNNNVYESQVRITVREPVLTVVPIDVTMAQKQTKTVSWQLLMEGHPAPLAIPVQAQPDQLIPKVLSFVLKDSAQAIYEMRAVAGDKPGVSPVVGTYDFGGGYVAQAEVDVTVAVAPGVFITPDTTILEANQTQLIRFYAKWSKDNAPVTNAQFSTTDIRGPGLQNVEQQLVAIDAAQGLYGYRVTTNHKGGPIAVRTNITSDGIPYPVFFDLISKSTAVTAVALNTLPAADTQWLEFRVEQERLGGLTALPGAVAKQFTVTGTAVVGVQGAVEAVGQGVYRLKVVTNDRGGSVNVSAVLTIDGEDYSVSFSTTAAALGKAMVISSSPALKGETTQPVPLEVYFNGQLYDLGSPSVTVTGTSLISYGAIRRTGVGKYEIQDVNVNGKGGILSISLTGKVQGFSQTMGTTVAVDPVANVVASNITHYRPTTQGPLQFTALRDGVVLSLTFSNATLTGGGVDSYTPTVEVVDANKGRYQVKNVVASAPVAQAPIGVSIPYRLRGYSYTLVFNSYTEAMPKLTVDTKGLIPAGSVKADYPLYFQVDGVDVDLEDSNITGSGPAFVSIDSPKLEQVSLGVWAVKGLLPGPDRGVITFTGTVKIDGITYPINVPIRSKDTQPVITNPSLPPGTTPPGSGPGGAPGPNDGIPYVGPVNGLEPEIYQTVYFTLAKKSGPVGDAVLLNGKVTGPAIESYDGFAVSNPATGTYRFNVMTNGKGGYVEISMDIVIDGDTYPTTYRSYAKPAKAWSLDSAFSPLSATSDQQIIFSVLNDGKPIGSPYLRALDVNGSAVRAAKKNLDGIGLTPFYSYRTDGIRTGSGAGDVKLFIQGSTNNINWHDMDLTWQLQQASAPVATVGPMIPALATSIITVRIQRDGKPLFAPTFANLTVSGAPVDTATLDWVKLNANGTYGTTVKTNDKGGPIDITFDIIDDGVTYPVSLQAQADIVRPWTAVLKSSAPKPEAVTYIDFQSMYGGAPIAMTNPKVRLVGSCVVAPADEVTPIYQDGNTQTYRVPNVLVNNDGGPITLEISGTVYDQQVSTVIQMNVTQLPAMQIVGVTAELPFRQTVDWAFDVNRGAGNPSTFASSDVSNLKITGAAIAGYTPTIVPVGGGRYKVSVQTNSVGGQVDMSFDVTIAGQTNSLALQINALVEPPVTAKSLNTLETNATATNMDFQLMRGTVPCADSFVVKSVSMKGRSITAYPQTVLNVDVATGKYRMQVNTSAYNDPVDVTIQATVRGEDVTLTFQVQVQQGVLPVVTVDSSALIYNLLSSVNLLFKQGTTVINSEVTITNVEGPLDQWSQRGSNQLQGIPTQKGQSTLKITFQWKAALYTGTITINPINSVFVTPIGDPKLKAYVANKVNFPLVQEDGSAYPANTTFTVASAPFTATTLVKEADGTFSMNLTYAGELATTNIIVTATNGTAVTKHIIGYSVWYNLEARFSGTSLLDSTQVSNQVQFDVYETNQNNVFPVYSGVDVNSLDVDAPNPDDLVGFSTFQILSATQYRGTFFVSTKPVDLSDLEFQFYWTSPLNRVYTVKGKFRVQKPVQAVWPTTVNLTGGDPATIQFTLQSGSLPITDAVDAGTTVSTATIKKAPYVVDASRGIYAIDLVPNGNATSLNITLKVKQQLNNLTSTLAVKSFPVTPGAYAAVPMLTLARQIESQNLDVQFTQGGIPLSGVVINSVTFDGAIKSLGTATTVSGTTYRWPAVVSLDGATPHMVFNITVGGVGMILEVDYPIAAPVEPEVYFFNTFTLTRGQVTEVVWGLKIGSKVYGEANGYTATTGDNAELTTLSQSSFLETSTALYRMKASIVPKIAGTAVVMHMPIIYQGVSYNAKFAANVVDAAVMLYQGSYDLRVNQEATINFRIDPPKGVTLDPTAVPTLTTPPFPITQAIVANGDGTYTMKVKPATETRGNAAVGTIVSGGTTYVIGAPPSIPARWNMALGIINTSVFPVEASGGTIATYNLQSVDAVTGERIVAAMSNNIIPSNVRVSSPVDVLNGTPVAAVNNTYYTRFTVPTKKVDFAKITFLVDFTSANGFEYKDIPAYGIAADTVVWTHLPPENGYLMGQKYDVKFQLKFQTSGNPVTNAVYKSAHTVTNGVADPVLKVIDAANGIYAVPVQFNTGASSVTITPKAGFEVDPKYTAQGFVSYTTLSGAATTVNPVSALTSTLPMLTANASGQVTTLRSQFLGFKANNAAGLVGSKLTAIGSTNYNPAASGLDVAEAEQNLWYVPLQAGTNSQAPSDGWMTRYTAQPTLTFTKDGVTTSHQLNAEVISNVVPVTAMTELTTLGGEWVLTCQSGVTGGFTGMASMPIVGWTLYGIDGEVITGLNGGVSSYAADNKIRMNMPELPAIRHGVIVVQTMNNSNNIKINVGGHGVEVLKLGKTTITDGGVMTVGGATTVTFSLVPPAGVTYNNPTVSVENNPWTTAGTLVDNGNGTYSIAITPDVETGGRIIKLKVIQDGKTYYHGVKTVAKNADPVVMKMYQSSSDTMGGLNGGWFAIYDKNGVEQMWNLSGNEATLPHSSVKATTTAQGVTVGGPQFQNQTLLQRLGILATTSGPAGSADYADVVFEADVTSPVTGLTQHVSYTQGVAKAFTCTFDTTVVPVWGVETTIPFTLKYSSGAPVSNPVLVSATITAGTATVVPTLITIDAAAGKYGVKVTTGSTASCTLSLVLRIGNLLNTSTFTRSFTSTAGGTVTMSAMAGATRTIGIKLAGVTQSDVITAVSGGAIMDAATGGPWTPTENGMFFVPLPASNRNRPANTNTTPTTGDTINVTYTRDGKSVTVPIAITVVWANAKVTGLNLTSNLLQFSGVINGADSKWLIYGGQMINETGVSLGNTSTVTNTISTDGKVNWNLSSRLAAQKYFSFTGAANNGYNSTYYYWTDPFEIVRVPYLVMSPAAWNYTTAQSNAGKAVDLADMALTFTDDTGAPVSGVAFKTVPSNFAGIFQPRIADGTDWSKALVPVTNGSDGKYILKLSQTGAGYSNYWVNVFTSTFVFSTSIGDQTMAISARIN